MPRLEPPAERAGERGTAGPTPPDARWAPTRGAADLRTPVLGASAWAAALVASTLPGRAGGVLLVLTLLGGVLGVVLVGAVSLGRVTSVRGADVRTTLLALTVVFVGVLASALLRAEAVADNPVAELAEQRAVVDLVGRVVSDPRPVAGPFAEQVVVRLQVHEVVGRGLRHRLSTPVLLIADDAWSDAALGAEVETTGRLATSDGDDLAAIVLGASAPVVLDDPDVWWRGAAAVRASVRDAVAGRPAEQRVLVPALVDGDDAGLDPAVEEDFRATGLTHLTAVSGTNLTLLVGFLLVVARWVGVRGRWLRVVAGLGIVGFVLLARTEPSVLRAAAMGTVGLLAMSANGRQRALRGLGVAVVALLLVEPGLARTAGFALSVLATAGIVLLGPPWRDALARWMPRWAAEAVAVPTSAQLACTPVVAAISGQVSLVAVLANLLVAPVVGPATVLGLTGGLVGLVHDGVASWLGTGAAWCVAWVVVVARHGALAPVAAIDWGTGVLALGLLTLLVLAIALLGPRLVRHPLVGVPVVLVLLGAALVRLPSPGWPGDDWVVAMCDVGQGDALALRAGPGAAVVVDAGPESGPVDRCLTRLHVVDVPLVVLTHFHADHVDGLTGVLDGRRVGAVWTTTLLDPPLAVEDVVDESADVGVRPTLAPHVTHQVGDVGLQVLWPQAGPARTGPGDGSTANDASVVMLADVGGVSILLTGDVEPPGQEALARSLPGLDVDVLKVPHHGSRYQDLDWLTGLGEQVALVSVGDDNTYGHPNDGVLDALEAAGAEVARTDEDGDVVVGADLEVRTSG